MLLQLKENVVSVPCTLGGGAHGFIGIILSAPTYATLAPNTPFVNPTHPGALAYVPGATQYEIAAAKTLHEEAIETYHAYELVQRALVQQVLEAIDTKYLSNLRNRVTGQVPSQIRLLMLHLFRIYGKFSQQQLRAKYDAVESMEHIMEEPIDLIFDAVEDLREIGELAARPYSPAQIVDLGYIILAKNRLF